MSSVVLVFDHVSYSYRVIICEAQMLAMVLLLSGRHVLTKGPIKYVTFINQVAYEDFVYMKRSHICRKGSAKVQ